MKQIKKFLLLFVLGAIGYGSIEMIWRGRTHWTMMIAGGLCFILFSMVAELFRGHSAILKATVCAVGVTAIEFIFGVIFNLWLRMGIWDYSDRTFNILGQVCPFFTVLWAGIALAFLPLADMINKNYS
jgi:hypothetical protein